MERLMDMLRTFFAGIAIGMANVIPGVSGGTLAVVFNIYDRLVNAVTLNVRKLWANRRFVLPVLCGMALGVIIFSRIITVLYAEFPVQTDCAFTGLILGTVPLLLRYVLGKNSMAGNLPVCAEDGGASGSEAEDGRPGNDLRRGVSGRKFLRVFGVVLCALAGFFLIAAFSFLENSADSAASGSAALPEISFSLEARVFAAGVLGAMAMVIPGISGSLLMLIMGVYSVVISSISALFSPGTFLPAFLILLPFGAGVIAGFLLGARLISVLLRKIPAHTYAVILGLLCGSAVTLFPGARCFDGVARAVSCAVCMLAGIFTAFFFSRERKAS